MITQLLTLEATISAFAAALLLLFPIASARVLGFPAASGLWPRVAGALFLGLAFGTGADLAGWTKPGLQSGVGLAGYIAVNLSLAFVLVSMLVVGPPLEKRRGRIGGWLMAAALLCLALLEISHL